MYYDQKESGKRVQYLRKNKGLTQEQLAEKLNIALSTLGKIETGQKGGSIDLAIEIALFFDVSLDYILLGRELQTDKLKQQIREMLNQLMEIEQKL